MRGRVIAGVKGTPLNVLQELGRWPDYKAVLRYANLVSERTE